VAQAWRITDLMSIATIVKGAAIAAILAGTVLTFACGLWLHTPSDRDDFFHLVAVDFKQPALCDRIDWRADGTIRGWEHLPIWPNVRTLRAACRSDLAAPPHMNVAKTPFWMEEFAAQVRAAGYTDADVLQAAYEENYQATPVHDAYERLRTSDEFRTRLRGAPGYDEPRDRARVRPAKPIEFMFQMIAVDAPEPALCAKVSPNATFEDGGSATALLQSRCYLHIAFNTRDPRWCDPLPASGSFPHINEVYDSREKCRETVAIYSRPDFKGNSLYGSSPFRRAADFQTILREIGYRDDQMPSIPALAPNAYWEFVSRLLYRAPPSARAEFLRRVEAMN
jgi:hypothetical protein